MPRLSATARHAALALALLGAGAVAAERTFLPLGAKSDPVEAMSRCAALYTILRQWADVRPDFAPAQDRLDRSQLFFAYATADLLKKGGLSDKAAEADARQKIIDAIETYTRLMQRTHEAAGVPFRKGDDVHNDVATCASWELQDR